MVRIGFDIDGVALEYTERMAEVFRLFGGKTDLLHVQEFNFFKSIREEELKSLYLAFGYMMQEKLSLHADFQSLLSYMINVRQQPLHFVTARQENLSKSAACESLRDAFIALGYHDRLSKLLFRVDCTGIDGKHGSKVPLIKEHGMQYFVEDRRKNVLEIAAAGVTVFMPRRSWNALPEDTPNVIQYNDSSEIVRYLKNQEIYT